MASANKLTKEFYRRGCVKVARELIGKVIVRRKAGKVYSGMIVETEAYPGKTDPASHSYGGRTKRNDVMFRAGGVAYVYFTYGNHYCFNVVTGRENEGNAVLIRAVEPLEGTEEMIRNRFTADIHNLTSGPGKFTKAFDIDLDVNGADLLGDVVYITGSGKKIRRQRSQRIGITKNKEKLYRFFAAGNPFVSGKKRNRVS